MSLKIRKKHIKKLADNCKFKPKFINDLMFEVKLPTQHYENIKYAAINYISKSFNDEEKILTESKLLKKILRKPSKIKNLTPNGLMAPKIENSLEFNTLIKAYASIIDDLKIEHLIENFHFPANIRIKFPKPNLKNLKRKHPTETMHADTWTGAKPNWCAVHLFLLGDVKKNNIRYAYPPKNFEENWLKPVSAHKESLAISKKFKIINYTPKKGYLIFADASIIHQSYREKKAGIRISLDTGIDIKMKNLKSFNNSFIDKIDVRKIRKNETITKKDFLNIGKKTYFHFFKSLDEKNRSKGAFKHPAVSKMIRLK